MNLADALATVIDAARQMPENKQLNAAIKRVEKKLDRMREQNAVRALATTIFSSVEEANKTLSKCCKNDGLHEWTMRHATADYAACICDHCHKCMRLNPDFKPLPRYMWDIPEKKTV